jgi:hypothetical protein
MPPRGGRVSPRGRIILPRGRKANPAAKKRKISLKYKEYEVKSEYAPVSKASLVGKTYRIGKNRLTKKSKKKAFAIFCLFTEELIIVIKS